MAEMTANLQHMFANMPQEPGGEAAQAGACTRPLLSST